jgi:hypothetical protein
MESLGKGRAVRAVLRRAVLRRAVLCHAVPCHAVRAVRAVAKESPTKP